MAEFIAFGLVFMVCWYAFLAVKAALYWVWERVLAIRAFSLALSLECRRRRDRRRAELRVNKDALDQYRLAQNAATLRDQQQQEFAATLRRAFQNLSGLPGLTSLAAEAGHAGDLAVKTKRELFNEFLPAIAREAETCLRSGVASAALRKFLTHLALACGHSDVQADLIVTSAEARVQLDRDADDRPGFASLVQQELALHRERLHAIEQLRDDPTYEQVLEVEHSRHSRALVQLSTGERNSTCDAVTL